MKYRLEELCLKITDGSHSSPKAQIDGFPMFSVKDMLEYDFDRTGCKRISAEDFAIMKKNGCVPQKNDILVAKDGSYLKQIFLCEETREEAILSSIAIFRPNTAKILPEFLCYLLKSPQIYNYIASNCVSGSALPRIVLKDFKNVVMDVPSKEQQKKIVELLLPLDKKIQLNNAINNNLQQQAFAVFDNMFPKISDGEKTIGDYITPKRGKNLLSKDAIAGIVPVVAGGLEAAAYHNVANTAAPVLTISASGANAGFVNLWHSPVWSSDSSFIDSAMTDNVLF